jgi:hypothetical protein
LRKGEAGLFGLASSIVLYDITKRILKDFTTRTPKPAMAKTNKSATTADRWLWA